MLWFLLAIASALIFAAQELLMRVLAIRTGSPRIFAVLFNLWGALFAVILFLFERGSLSGLFGLTPMQYLFPHRRLFSTDSMNVRNFTHDRE